MSKKYAVLFVCTGNICRSPTAEAHFRREVRRKGLQNQIKTDSAGTYAGHAGEKPNTQSIHHALLRGIEMDDLRARHVRNSDFEEFDLILAMDKSHLKALKAHCPPEHQDKLHLYLSFAQDLKNVQEVPDPYGNTDQAFETVLDLIEATTPHLLAFCQKNISENIG